MMTTENPIPGRLNVLCFGGEDWWYHNRGHIDIQLMRRFARWGTTLYVNSLVMQRPTFHPAIGGGKSFSEKLLRKTGSMLRGLRATDAGFWVYSPFSLPVYHIPGLDRVNRALLTAQVSRIARRLRIVRPVVWVACPVACALALPMEKGALVYQRTDRFEEYPNVDADAIRAYDEQLKQQADLTLYVSRSLYEEERSRCRKALYLDHGVDFDLFARAGDEAMLPADLRDIRHPILGFFGGIDGHTSDIPFLEELVRILPEFSFVFVGRPSADVKGLLLAGNVWLLGQKLYEQIPHYGKCFDVAIMVWQQNRWIDGCNPVKLKEYLALGKPVVSTPFPQLQGYSEVVYQAATPPEFAARVKQALAEDTPARVAARRAMIQDATWDAKAQLVWRELASLG
jgi:glycosyltransferase involved in cell wall biosynthesis